MVGLGNAAKKIQQLSDLAEKLYARMNEVREKVDETQERVDDTHQRVGRLEHKVDEQRALIEAIADEHDIDVEQVAATAAIEEAEGDSESETTSGESTDDTTNSE
ncbi:hypothetical protein DM867_10195 [Halosegnis rubeus]|jgi:uncharacterized coiled-coil DUF342 family protein|uniref:Uncharacterized protein n=1 Tax=Halosegnis rubeus TaxID=2212850 RepID=A0A5N5UF56_9EURY|nr:DUF5798 family protein [Halosegnis rubeus]KAB7513340.1 hypothetical protein DM867_10195 [Halosegnis rubeus]KAB7517323.1 hypothetical protein DP108_09940 [Halosegnis rubeus]KAB7518444.1 hypothetical protein DMP03_03545 [Halosegnis rubeus]